MSKNKSKSVGNKVVNPNASNIGKVMRGTVKWFNVQKGFGFITGEDGKDYFIHSTNIEYGRQYPIAFDAEDEVEFTIIESKKNGGVQAGMASICDYDDEEEYEEEYEEDTNEDDSDYEYDEDDYEEDEEDTVDEEEETTDEPEESDPESNMDDEAETVYSDKE